MGLCLFIIQTIRTIYQLPQEFACCAFLHQQEGERAQAIKIHLEFEKIEFFLCDVDDGGGGGVGGVGDGDKEGIFPWSSRSVWQFYCQNPDCPDGLPVLFMTVWKLDALGFISLLLGSQNFKIPFFCFNFYR